MDFFSVIIPTYNRKELLVKALSSVWDQTFCDYEVIVVDDEFHWLGKSATFVSHDHAGDRFSNYLFLMTQATNFIISNSTFAWWAAWLSKSQDKEVIAPRQWFRDRSIDSSDLCPPEWILV